MKKCLFFICLSLSLSLPLSGCRDSSAIPDKTSIEFQGYVEGELLYMAAPFSGDLKSLFVQRGHPVKKKDRLFNLDEQPQQAQLLASESAILQARANEDLTQTRLERAKELYQDKAIQKDALDAALEDQNEAQALLEQAIQKNEEAKWNIKKKTGLSPTEGVIYDIYFKKGEFVASGLPVLSLLAPENIRIIFFLPEKILSQVKVGDALKVEAGNKYYQVKINYISPQVEFTPPVIFSRENDATLVYRVKAIPLLSQAYDFHPGQPVRLRFLEKAH